ncbi:MAG TPA: glycosyltransferase family 1 protein [Acidimicrobiales bacterium]|nr:glycosyltransferase family 1 protein [Acidimicrobiales bacterium]
MTLLFDAHHLGRRQSGNEVWTRNIVRAMQPLLADGEMEYAVSDAGLDELRCLTGATTHLVHGSSLRRLAFDLPRIARARSVSAMFAAYTAPLTRRPIVLQVHDVAAWHRDAGTWLPLATRLQYRATVGSSARLAHHVVTLSGATQRDLIEKLGVRPERVSIAGAAVDFDLANVLASTPRRENAPAFRVLAVGNVLPRKNLTLLARAVRACRDSGADMQLRIVGSVPKAGRQIAEGIRNLLGPAVHLTGYVELEQLAIEYMSADALGFPSLLEGFGIPVTEAMTAGVPVVVSNTSSLPEVVGDAALIRAAGDVAGWRDALMRLYDEPALREELRQRGLRQASRFSWHDSAKVVVDRLRVAAGASSDALDPG